MISKYWKIRLAYWFVNNFENRYYYIKYAIRHLWHRLYIRKDQFHTSLDTDIHYLMYVAKNKDEREKYIHDLIKRRGIAHRRDL